ncbi:hypothetical protein [Bradyrhizobium neotropicale]|uniref:Uncharacterized protein n=1 Tax=Bradyrhizobium neotropicale TaxID=1497615 RepID=A0A176Z1M8_9BRAD|nr:hypothetical protein [Bradyrhizobium neotropicale]OAF14569.1 hypothetical protein AXW67_17630 [Bradyrhizobium neotropicale]
MPNEANTAIELFGTGDLTAAVNAIPADQHDALEDRFGLLADWVPIRQRIHLNPNDRRRFLRFDGAAKLGASASKAIATCAACSRQAQSP